VISSQAYFQRAPVAPSDAGKPWISRNQIAREMNHSAATLSAWLKGTYKGNNDNVTHAANMWIDRRARRQESQTPTKYVETWAVQEMAAMVRLADRRQKMAAIVAPPGSGKDMVIDALAEQLNGIVIYCSERTTPFKLLEAWAVALSSRLLRGNGSLERRIIEAMRGRSMIVFLNEAQQLPKSCASTIRMIYDETKVPIVMFGSDDIFNFIDDRAGARGAGGGGQFYRRCIKFNLKHRATLAEDPHHPGKAGRPLFTKDEVKKVLQTMPHVRLTGEVLALMTQIANLTRHGTLGLACDVIETIGDLWPGQPITRENVLVALSTLLADDAVKVKAELALEQDEHRKAEVA